ncbi:hypothetical protein ACC793_37585, partial [Rhizobium ruizarguesonis]
MGIEFAESCDRRSCFREPEGLTVIVPGRFRCEQGDGEEGGGEWRGGRECGCRFVGVGEVADFGKGVGRGGG